MKRLVLGFLLASQRLVISVVTLTYSRLVSWSRWRTLHWNYQGNSDDIEGKELWASTRNRWRLRQRKGWIGPRRTNSACRCRLRRNLHQNDWFCIFCWTSDSPHLWSDSRVDTAVLKVPKSQTTKHHQGKNQIKSPSFGLAMVKLSYID